MITSGLKLRIDEILQEPAPVVLCWQFWLLTWLICRPVVKPQIATTIHKGGEQALARLVSSQLSQKNLTQPFPIIR